MNIAQALGVFLAFYASRSTKGAQIPFPGNVASFVARHTEVGQRTLGRAHIFCADLTLEKQSNGEVYNIGDTDITKGTSWAEKWPALCEYFGLIGVGPEEGGKPLRAGEYMRTHRSEWETWEYEHGLMPRVVESTSWGFMEVILEMASFDRQYDLSKLAVRGFAEKEDVIDTYTDVFNSMRETKMIP